ncbi:MAG: serine/threonine-protein kinase [Myxococcales bacterium]|nr:serine/threonine-protein kinase [Myxococcales bacterium]
MLSAGERIRDYEVWGRLGGGGMGDVWLARHVVMAAPVIIKTLRAEIGDSPADREKRMVTEARLMARISSPNVVRALDVGTHAEIPYIVQEYVDGIDMNELDHSRRESLGLGLPLWFVCDAAAQIAHGLHAAHQHGILHRDLKPSNLFGAADGNIKLGDFGIAVQTQISEKNLAGSAGTVRFMPPEALRHEPLDRRADVYGLGATLYDLRYGVPPFSRTEDVLDPRLTATCPSPESAEEAYFQHVLGRMLEKDKEVRLSDITEARRAFSSLARVSRPACRPARRVDGSISLGSVRVVSEAANIALAQVDGIVSSANWQLVMRTGVSEALRLAGGDELEEEALSHGEQPLGACVATGPGRLHCRRVLHAVSAWEEASCIGRALQRALLLAERLGLRSLAVPALGTGAARVTLEAAAQAQAAVLRWYLSLGGSRLQEVRFILYDDAKLRVFRDVLESELFGMDDDPPFDAGRKHGASELDASAPTEIVSALRPSTG